MANKKTKMKELRRIYEQARERFYAEFGKMDRETNPYLKKLYIRHKKTDKMFCALLAQSSVFWDGE